MSGPSDATTDDVSSCWVGDRLLPIAQACINSFTARGVRFGLYVYNPVADVPPSVICRDAGSMVAPESVFLAHGGYETFADRLALRVLQEAGGWWVDNDVVCNTPSLPAVEVAFAEESDGIINNAVLKFPPQHPAIVDLLAHIDAVDPVSAPWGSTGPRALSDVLPRHDLARYCRPRSDFYEFHWKECPKFLFPEFTDEVLSRTRHSSFIHLYGSALREVGFDFKRWRPLPGSYLDRLYTAHLNPDVADRLEPLDEGAFRRSVQDYVSGTWNVELSLV